MIDYFAIAVTHALIALACLRLLMRDDLDRDPPPAAQPDAPAPDPAAAKGKYVVKTRRHAVLELFMAGFVRLFLAMGLRRPFIWVLAFMYVDIVAPQKIALAAGRSAIVAGGVSAGGGGLAVSRQQGGHPYQLPPGLMAALLFYCFFTTQVAWFLLLPPPSGAGCGNRWYGPSSCLSRCAPGCGWRRPRW
jgi:hypothetical protein